MIQKERAINWVNTYFSQKEESLYHDLEIEIKNKHVDCIVNLSSELYKLKEKKAIILEYVMDSVDIVELVHIVLDWEELDRELEVDYIEYIFDVRI
jgi:hypothetical protein